MPIFHSKIRDWMMARGVALAMLLALGTALTPSIGCKPHVATNPNLIPDQAEDVTPEETATLTELTHQVRRTMSKQRLSGTFEDFAAVRSDLTIPPPPDGKKYAITSSWKVILVDANKAK
jgi:hypothetical protein